MTTETDNWRDELVIELSGIAEVALSKVLALRKLSYENQTVTRRSQNAVLQTLNDQDTLAVADALARHQAKFGW
jgi:hypothetical protein